MLIKTGVRSFEWVSNTNKGQGNKRVVCFSFYAEATTINEGHGFFNLITAFKILLISMDILWVIITIIVKIHHGWKRKHK